MPCDWDAMGCDAGAIKPAVGCLPELYLPRRFGASALQVGRLLGRWVRAGGAGVVSSRQQARSVVSCRPRSGVDSSAQSVPTAHSRTHSRFHSLIKIKILRTGAEY